MSENPKVFISYSWTSQEHQDWVLSLATALVDSGVDVILDKWELREGSDATAFMEQMVSDPSVEKVLIVCDRAYVEKANERSGGVGTETQIISSEIYKKRDQDKFVAVVTEDDAQGVPCVPVYYRSRIHIDMRDEAYTDGLERLLRWIYNKPLYRKPDIGRKPAFLSDEPAISLGTSAVCRRALDAIKNGKASANGALSEYFDTYAENLERFRLVGNEGEFDEQVVKSIEDFRPYRDEAVQVFAAMARYMETSHVQQLLHRFFEQLMPYLWRPEGGAQRENEWDNLKFMVHELFLYAIAILLRHECFEAVAYMLNQRYYVRREARDETMLSFAEIRKHMPSLETYDKRQKVQHKSLRATMLKQRSEGSAVPFHLLMQTDFMLYLRDCIDHVRDGGTYRQIWWPETLVYTCWSETPFEAFARSESVAYFSRFKRVLDIAEKTELEPVWMGFASSRLHLPSWEGDSFSPARLACYQQMATRP